MRCRTQQGLPGQCTAQVASRRDRVGAPRTLPSLSRRLPGLPGQARGQGQVKPVVERAPLDVPQGGGLARRPWRIGVTRGQFGTAVVRLEPAKLAEAVSSESPLFMRLAGVSIAKPIMRPINLSFARAACEPPCQMWLSWRNDLEQAVSQTCPIRFD